MDEDLRETIDNSARYLYGLIHARYIITTRGLAKMVSMPLFPFLVHKLRTRMADLTLSPARQVSQRRLWHLPPCLLLLSTRSPRRSRRCTLSKSRQTILPSL